ncbi:biotin synthase BioB [Chelatococcus reniformis]|nr:biotin synthase BioB [Chelatococcus reniformis]
MTVESTDANLRRPPLPQREESRLRHDWTLAEAMELYRAPLNDLLFLAHRLHRSYFEPNEVQLARLLSIKTGGCPEDCGYCSQSAHHKTGVKATKLAEVETVLREARKAKEAGATRYCMGAAWRNPKARDMDAVVAMIKGVREMGMETCVTLGMLTAHDAARLKEAGLDYYNHNIDTSPRYYRDVITTRTFADRLDTLSTVREAGINVCCGGIVGMGETAEDRADMLVTLANLPDHPESVPINMLIAVPGTPLAGAAPLDPIDFVRTAALARIMMPASTVRIAAGRKGMSTELQALCFFAGVNSIFVGETLLTAGNPEEQSDAALFARLGLTAAAAAPARRHGRA